MSQRLPGSIETIEGLRVARWIRESSAGQFDNFGPDASEPSRIGRSSARAPRYRARVVGRSVGLEERLADARLARMLGAAATGGFDILVVGYVSRFLRNLKQTLIAIEDHLQRAGVAVLFAESACSRQRSAHWSQLVREGGEAEAYSRKLSKRVAEGYEAKRRRLGVPGGNRAPYGIVREGNPSILRIDEAKAAIVRRRTSRGERTDRLGGRSPPTGLAQDPRRRDPTNPIYAGRLRTGEPAGDRPSSSQPLVRVPAARERRRTRSPAGLSSASTRSACAARAAAGSSTATSGTTATQHQHAMHSSPLFRPSSTFAPGGPTGGSRATPTRKPGTRKPSEAYSGTVGPSTTHTISEVVALQVADTRSTSLPRPDRPRAREAGRQLTRDGRRRAWQAR